MGGYALNRANKFLEAFNGEAALIHRPENVRWLTGYTGEGCVYISRTRQAIITDFRYIEAAGREAPECAIERTTSERKEPAVVGELLSADHVTALSIETDYLTWDQVKALEAALPVVRLDPLKELPQTLRMIKDDHEIDCIQRACEISSKAFANILERLKPGMTERQVQIMLDYEMLSLGSGGNAFDTIAAAGVNGSLPHAVPSDYVIQIGDLLTLDFGATVEGYCADMTRTVGFGHIGSELRAVYDCVLKAQTMALAAVCPGAVCADIDRIARDHIEARYPGAFGHSLGHGVGLFIHEQPRLARTDTTVLQPGHVVTVEPGVYIPGLGGCRIEDTTIVTERGMIDPVTAPKELIEL
ncbi:MAG: aminopeptidase P family protein [Clostridiales bacterium]|nr:aminopeptidase P family protein [Clostridiales bacterium]